MRFHEDVIFKNNGQKYGQPFLKIMNISGKIVEVHETEYSLVDPKMYKPDFVFELEEKIIILEFQSTAVYVKEKKRFRFYSALIDQIKNKSNKDIEVHVLSTVEKEQTKIYKINAESFFTIYIHSLKKYDGDEFLNTINNKIRNNKDFTVEELLLLSLVPFMQSDIDIEHIILKTAQTIVQIKNITYDIGQFIKGVELLLTDKFVKTESINIPISNLIGGNMKIVEDYAQRVAREKVTEEKERTIQNMSNEGMSEEDIIKYTKYDEDLVKKALAK